MELWPNHELLSPSAVVERRDPTISVRKRDVRPLSNKKVCHYLGKIRGKANSRVAISTCDGLVRSSTKYYEYDLYGNDFSRLDIF